MQCKILLVDDDTAICDTIRDCLTHVCSKSHITVCHTAREALKNIEDNSYDIVITDLGLERGILGGDAVVDAAKNANIFTVISSGSDIIPSALKAKCDFVLRKPWAFEDLQRMVDTAKKSMGFVKAVKAKYLVSAKEQDVKLELEALADKMTSKDQYVIFTKTKDLKYDKDLTGGEEEILGLVGFPQSDLYDSGMIETVKKAKFAHLVTLVKAKFLPYDLEIDEAKGKKLFNKWKYVPSYLSAAKKKEVLQQKFDWEWPKLGQKKTLSTWIRLILDNERPEERAKNIVAMGYNALENYTKRVIFLDPKAYQVETVFRLEMHKEKKLDKNLTPEEQKLLDEYAPEIGDHTSFRVTMTSDKLQKDVHKMSDDDLAWHLLNSKHAMAIGDEDYVGHRLGFREICLLQLMNKNITKKDRTQVAEYMLDKMGVSFVGGPTLKKYIAALAKTGAVDASILKASQEDDLTGKIYYGKISDPDELRKVDYKKYDYQLAHNQHTPADVLEKIVEYQKKTSKNDGWSDPEVKWSGSNPQMGGVAGDNFYFSFSDALSHHNYPLDKLLEVYKKYLAKYKKPKAVKGMIRTLWSRPDLPKELGHQFVKDAQSYEKPEYWSASPPACFDEKEFLEYWKKIKKVQNVKDMSISNLLSNPHIPTEVLKDILEKKDVDSRDKQEIYKKLRDDGVISDKEVISKVKKDLKFDGPDELLKQFGPAAWAGTEAKEKLKFTPVSENDISVLKKEMETTTVHDDFTFDIVSAYRVDKQIHKDYHTMAKDLGNIKHGLYHGTSMANAAGILASGIDTEADSRTGQMFGAGFYLASSASKAAQYASDNFSKSGLGVVFKMDVALGKAAEWKYGRPNKDEYYRASNEDRKKIEKYVKEKGLKGRSDRHLDIPRWHLTHDSVHAKKGLALQHDEFVVKSGQQINITEIIIIHKEEKE